MPYDLYMAIGIVVLALFIPSAAVERTLHELTGRYGENYRLCVVPEGPQTIPYIRQPELSPNGA